MISLKAQGDGHEADKIKIATGDFNVRFDEERISSYNDENHLSFLEIRFITTYDT